MIAKSNLKTGDGGHGRITRRGECRQSVDYVSPGIAQIPPLNELQSYSASSGYHDDNTWTDHRSHANTVRDELSRDDVDSLSECSDLQSKTFYTLKYFWFQSGHLPLFRNPKPMLN